MVLDTNAGAVEEESKKALLGLLQAIQTALDLARKPAAAMHRRELVRKAEDAWFSGYRLMQSLPAGAGRKGWAAMLSRLRKKIRTEKKGVEENPIRRLPASDALDWYPSDAEQKIPLKSVEPHQDFTRDEDMAYPRQAIARGDPLESIEVRQHFDPKTKELWYEVEDGHHRACAAKEAGLSWIPAMIWRKVSGGSKLSRAAYRKKGHSWKKTCGRGNPYPSGTQDPTVEDMAEMKSGLEEVEAAIESALSALPHLRPKQRGLVLAEMKGALEAVGRAIHDVEWARRRFMPRFARLVEHVRVYAGMKKNPLVLPSIVAKWAWTDPRVADLSYDLAGYLEKFEQEVAPGYRIRKPDFLIVAEAERVTPAMRENETEETMMSGLWGEVLELAGLNAVRGDVGTLLVLQHGDQTADVRPRGFFAAWALRPGEVHPLQAIGPLGPEDEEGPEAVPNPRKALRRPRKAGPRRQKRPRRGGTDVNLANLPDLR